MGFEPPEDLVAFRLACAVSLIGCDFAGWHHVVCMKGQILLGRDENEYVYFTVLGDVEKNRECATRK